MHDPSTVILHAGHYYTYGTGNGFPILTSDDGWTWRRSGSLMSAVPGGKAGAEVLARGGNNTWAPDVIHIGDKFFVYYSAPATQPRSAIGLLVGRTLDPQSPDYQWEDGGPGGLVRRHRRQQRHRSRRVARSRRAAVAGLRLVLRLHPPRRARSEDGPAPLSGSHSR